MKIIFPPMSKNNNIKIMLMQEFIKIFRNFDWQRFRLAESPFLTIFFFSFIPDIITSYSYAKR